METEEITVVDKFIRKVNRKYYVYWELTDLSGYRTFAACLCNSYKGARLKIRGNIKFVEEFFSLSEYDNLQRFHEQAWETPLIGDLFGRTELVLRALPNWFQYK